MEKDHRMIKAFFIDLDGTLLDSKDDKGSKSISKENIREIKKKMEANVECVISTGRLGPELNDFMTSSGVNYVVSGNGSKIIDKHGKVYVDHKLSIKQFLLILDLVKKHKLAFKVDGEIDAYGCTTWLNSKISQSHGFIPRKHYNVEMHKEYNKIVIWGKAKGKMMRISNILKNNVDGISIVSSAGGYTIEITNEKATKGLGNLFVANLLGIKDKDKIAHIGDTMNDSTVVKHMKLIAMKNATKRLKEIASYIGPHYKNGGVAKILQGMYKKNVV